MHAHVATETTAPLPPVSVLCVDDNELVAEAIAVKLRRSGGFSIAGWLSSADALVETAQRAKPTVILLDVDMPGLDPLVALGKLTELGLPSKVVVFSGHVRPDLLDRAVEAGAWGYVSKSDGEEALLDGVRAVIAGQFAMSPEVRAVCDRA